MPQSDSVLSLVENFLLQGRYSAAMSKLIDISNQYSFNPDYLRLLIKTQKAIGDEAASIKSYEVLTEITQSASDQIELMNALYAQGRLNEALDIALMLQDMNLKGSEQQKVKHTLIKLYSEFGDYEGIVEIFNSMSDSDKDDLMLWAMGLVYIAEKQNHLALEMFRKCVSLNPANDKAWISLAMLHHEMGDRELALANLESAFDANPNNATGIKLLTKLRKHDVINTSKALTQVRHYLSSYEFDEEISLCYMQILKDCNDMNSLKFEAEKLVLNNPYNIELHEIKKNIEAGMKTI